MKKRLGTRSKDENKPVLPQCHFLCSKILYPNPSCPSLLPPSTISHPNLLSFFSAFYYECPPTFQNFALPSVLLATSPPHSLPHLISSPLPFHPCPPPFAPRTHKSSLPQRYLLYLFYITTFVDL